MKRKKRFYLPLRAYLLYLFLICFALTGVTFARYTTSSRGSDTARVAKISDLKITENGDFYEPGIFPVAPGADIQKDICVSFEGSEAACYAFLRLRWEGFSRTELTHYTYTDAQSGAQWLSFDVSTEDWTVLFEDGSTVVYYAAVKPNTAFARHVIAQNGKITVSSDMKRSDLTRLPQKLSFGVDAFAVQSSGFAGETEKEQARAAYDAVADR